MKPPNTYEAAMVAALLRARCGSGFSSPSSKRIIKSTHAVGLRFNAFNTGVLSSWLTP